MPKTHALKRAGGAQAEQAAEIGWTKITEKSARLLWEMDIPFIMVGNKVSPYHFFSGWKLAYEVEPDRLKAEGVDITFNKILNNFAFYLEPELGTRVAFFMRSRHIPAVEGRV